MLRFVLTGVWKSESAKENTVRKCQNVRRQLRSVPRQHRRFAIEHGNEIVDLLNVHGERLYRLLVRFTLREDVAEDLLQDLVVKLSNTSGFAAADDVYAYARKAAVNLAFSWIRSRRRCRERAFESNDPVSDDLPVWSRLVKIEDIRRLLKHMDSLGENDRLILAMRYFDEATYDEIARAMGRNAHQARAVCHRAVKRLRESMVEPQPRTLRPRTEVEP